VPGERAKCEESFLRGFAGSPQLSVRGPERARIYGQSMRDSLGAAHLSPACVSQADNSGPLPHTGVLAVKATPHPLNWSMTFGMFRPSFR